MPTTRVAFDIETQGLVDPAEIATAVILTLEANFHAFQLPKQVAAFQVDTAREITTSNPLVLVHAGDSNDS